MQVVEIKNDLVQVRYNSDEQAFSLGDFFVVSDNNSDVLAQIVHLESDETDSVCLAKFILNINPDQSTCMYNGYMPSLDSVISPVSKKEISEFIAPLADGIKMGSLINSDLPVVVSSTIFEFPLYIQADYLPACGKLLDLMFLKNKIGEKVFFYDTDGVFEKFDIDKYHAGKDFKLPLNEIFIDFIYQNDLNDLAISEKSLVQDILLEIKDYIKATDKFFIEFSTLFDVVENQYQEQPSEGLMLFRNKLIEYKQLDFFADTPDDAAYLGELLKNENGIFSVYGLPKNWQKIILKYLAECIDSKTHLVMQVGNKTVDEQLISSLFTSKFIVPVFISDYAFNFRKLLRSKVPNMIFFQAINEIDDFPLYANFLNILYEDRYIIWGEITNFLSVIVSPEMPVKKENEAQEVKNVKLILDKDVPKVEEEQISAEVEHAENDEVCDIENEVEPEEVTRSVAAIAEDTDDDEIPHKDAIIESGDVIEIKDEVTENAETDSSDLISDEETEVVETDSSDLISDEETDDEIILQENSEDIENVGEQISENDVEIVEANQDVQPEIVDEQELAEEETPILEEDGNITGVVNEEELIIENEETLENELEELVQLDEESPQIVEDIESDEEQDIQDDDLDFLQDDVADEVIDNSDAVIDIDDVNDSENDDGNSNDIEEMPESEEDILEFQDIDDEIIADEIEDDEETAVLSEEYSEDIAQDEFLPDDEEVHDYVENDYYMPDENDISEIPNFPQEPQFIEETEVVETPLQEPVYEEIKEPEFEMPVFSAAQETSPQESEIVPDFVEGNIVFHEKYGRGIIEKVISYGAKTLCSIQFDNIGRRLLDPNLANLKQV